MGLRWADGTANIRRKLLAFRESVRVPRVADGTRMKGFGPDRLRARKGRSKMKKQQKKQAGFIVSAELVLIATILVIGLIVGMVAIRDAVTAEMGDVAEAIGAIDQSYIFDGISDNAPVAAVAGSAWSDAADNGTTGVPGDQGAAGDEEGFNFSVTPDTDEDTQVAPLL
jgi:hypothetical protein